MLVAVRNNAIWVAIVPAVVTSLGLIFAVLTERIRWSLCLPHDYVHALGHFQLGARGNFPLHVRRESQ